MRQTVAVRGLREFISAADQAGKRTKKTVRDGLREAAEPVRDEARRLFAPVDQGTAARFGISVRRTGLVTVEQRLRKTTGRRPDFGALQMREALLPALESKQGEVAGRLEDAIDKLADRLEG